jgi:PqqD family protein of HPr-rel-A system
LLFEDFDDGIVLFDALVGSTHLVNVTAAEVLAVVQEAPGLDAAAIQHRVLERLDLSQDALPLSAVAALLQRFELLNIVRADSP